MEFVYQVLQEAFLKKHDLDAGKEHTNSFPKQNSHYSLAVNQHRHYLSPGKMYHLYKQKYKDEPKPAILAWVHCRTFQLVVLQVNANFIYMNNIPMHSTYFLFTLSLLSLCSLTHTQYYTYLHSLHTTQNLDTCKMFNEVLLTFILCQSHWHLAGLIAHWTSLWNHVPFNGLMKRNCWKLGRSLYGDNYVSTTVLWETNE